MDEDELYASYSAFKGWDRPRGPVGHQDTTNLLRQARLRGRLKILEIGCGAGDFMDWAKRQGHTIEGTEIIPEMVAAARARGHVVHLAPVSADSFAPESFDAIVAVDVIEHLDLASLRDLFGLARVLLKKDGRLIAQFPNGASPFSGRNQSGDFSHLKPLSPSAVRQIAEPMGLRVVAAFNPRSVPPGLLRALRRRAVYAIRDLVEVAVGYLYFGFRIPLDPNVVVTLGRRA
jgi:SAM-dependent methyltransferase